MANRSDTILVAPPGHLRAPSQARFHERPSFEVLVAAFDSSDRVKGVSHFVCDGTGDEEVLAAAVRYANNPSEDPTEPIHAVSGGGLVLSSGTYNLAGSVEVPATMGSLWIRSFGEGTHLILDAADGVPMFDLAGFNGSLALERMRLSVYADAYIFDFDMEEAGEAWNVLGDRPSTSGDGAHAGAGTIRDVVVHSGKLRVANSYTFDLDQVRNYGDGVFELLSPRVRLRRSSLNGDLTLTGDRSVASACFVGGDTLIGGYGTRLLGSTVGETLVVGERNHLERLTVWSGGITLDATAIAPLVTRISGSSVYDAGCTSPLIAHINP